MTNIVKRIVLFVIALFIIALGVSLSTRANLGTSPAACPPYVLSLIPGSPLSMGTYTFIMQSFFILIQILLLRHQFQLFQLFQFGVSFVFGFFTDLTMWLTQWIQPALYLLCWIQLIVGCAVVGLGVFLEVKSNILMLPGEGLVMAISRVGKWSFSRMKIINDVVITIIGILISIVFIGGLHGVREGTVASAFLVGIMVRILAKPLAFLELWLNPEQTEREVAGGALFHPIITIAREYYSKGSEIGTLVAKRMGVRCYDRDIIEQAAKELNYPIDVVSDEEQRLSIEDLMELAASWPVLPIKQMHPADAIFVTESQIIRQIAQKESCVIVGRCADRVLRDNPNLFRVFIYSSEDNEIQSLMSSKACSYKVAERFIREKNHERANHYKYYTGNTWGYSKLYDLTINTSKIDVENAVSLILQAVDK